MRTNKKATFPIICSFLIYKNMRFSHLFTKIVNIFNFVIAFFIFSVKLIYAKRLHSRQYIKGENI